MATRRKLKETRSTKRRIHSKRTPRKVSARKRAKQRVAARRGRSAGRNRSADRGRQLDRKRAAQPQISTSVPRSQRSASTIRGTQALGDDQYVVALAPNVVSAAAELGRGDLSAGITAAVVRVATEKLALAYSRQRPSRR